jgi:glutamate-1-semialdehyde 2,1-aminomutase
MLAEGLIDAAAAAGVPLALNRVGSMLTPFFVKVAGTPVENYTQATAGDTAAYATFFHAMLENGVMLPPSQYEAWFPGLAHTDSHIEQTIAAGERAFAIVAGKRQG